MSQLFKKDWFLEEIKKSEGIYQLFFNRLIKEIDDAVYARFLSGLPEAMVNELEREGEKIKEIFEEAEKKNLNTVVLFVLFLQYAKADVLDKNGKERCWVSIILKRKKIDFFPDHNGIIHILDKLGCIS